LPDHKGQTGQAEKAGKVAPGDVMVLRPVDRKIAAPGGLLHQGPAVGTDGHRLGLMRAHRQAPGSQRAAGMTGRGTRHGGGGACIVAVTSRYCGGASRGTMTFTFVRTVCRPKRNSLMATERGRASSICRRVPKKRAPLGQTVAHIGRLPTDVRS